MNPWRRPYTFTTLIPAPGDEDTLRAGLDRARPLIAAALEPRDDIHTLRMAAIPPGHGFGTRLMMNFVHDRPLDVELPPLCAALSEALAPLLGAKPTPELLLRHRQHENTYYIGAQGMTVRQIRADAALSTELSRLADAIPNGASAEAIRLKLQAAARATPEDRGSQFRRKLDFLICILFPLLDALRVDILAAINLIESASTRAFFKVAYPIWRIYAGIPSWLALASSRVLELVEEDIVAPTPANSHLELLESREDVTLKNPVTFWLPVRDTFVRRIVLRIILLGSEIGCRHIWTRGSLATIDTIHHARIMGANGGKTMLFMSDYDGGLNRYLDDFMGEGRRAVIPISSSLAGCPKTFWLNDPADPVTFGPRYRDLLRVYQIDTPVWYHAYPDLSIREVVENRRRREGLCAKSMTEEEARRFLRIVR